MIDSDFTPYFIFPLVHSHMSANHIILETKALKCKPVLYFKCYLKTFDSIAIIYCQIVQYVHNAQYLLFSMYYFDIIKLADIIFS